jgi:tetratricopeptide (TPR) repeat protein
MSRLRFCCFVLVLAVCLPAFAQHTMVMHSPESAQEEANSPCRNGMWARHIRTYTPEELGGFSHPITGSAAARAYFNQGLLFYYGFDTISAMQSFHEATEADPNAAMGYWGVALAAGGDLNIPIDDPCMTLAIDQARKAGAAAGRVSPAERLYINAIRVRYGLDESDTPLHRDPAQLSVPYMLAMREASKTLFEDAAQGQKDPDVAALYVVSLMNLRPWLWWTTSGQPSAEIDEALRVLREGLKNFPDHLGFNHFYVHAMEEAPVGTAAGKDVLRAANLLMARAPRMTPHLRHMPAHIYLLAGEWQGVVEANRRAVEADEPWRRECDDHGQGPLCNPLLVGHYMSHDLLFLTVGLANAGSWEPVKASAERTENNARQFIDEQPGLEHYLTTRMMMGTHYAQWEYVLSIPAPMEMMPFPDAKNLEGYCQQLKLPMASAMWYYGRTMAFSAKGQTDAANSNLYLYNLASSCAAAGVSWGNNPASAVLAVTHWKLLARLAQDRGELRQSAEFAQLAVEMEDLMLYDEPPGWYVSSRETQGAALYRLASRKLSGDEQRKTYEHALQVFEDDLARHPNASRALYGKWRCFEALGRSPTDIAKAKGEFLDQWGSAPLPSMDDL